MTFIDQILTSKINSGNNLTLLIGSRGCGKSTIGLNMYQNWLEKNEHKFLLNVRLVEIE